jgi:hypothetical protein
MSYVTSKKGLASFENHLVGNREQLIDEQPSAIRAVFIVVAIFKKPHASSFVEIDLALNPA